MLRREIVTVCSEIHTKNTNALHGQNVDFLNVRTNGKRRSQLDLV